ncbi:adenine phosphoribosyltransferase [Nocardioides sp. ChNu-99]|uniref:adenine phosphoribosyltransferase n=1 Tax=Nocardioides sp. ChNu-99 TaxID=2839897 RepID=UPI002404D294|nr:adenine phosphoribosyltransferase [Nocardioides sp. ChNu-99]MDF9715355.1 adenine phosphoribosyltransferase [Nocardioides sp. ChNu-99]
MAATQPPTSPAPGTADADAVRARRAAAAEAVRSTLLDVPDFPQPGVVFKDVTPLLADPAAFAAVVAALADVGRGSDGAPVVDKVVGMEARGFLFGTPVAQALGVGFVPVRKPGKLPRATHEVDYDLEYGSTSLALHVDALAPGDRVLVVDDVLATGGTAAATRTLVERCGAHVVGIALLLELTFLPGRAAVDGVPVTALLQV